MPETRTELKPFALHTEEAAKYLGVPTSHILKAIWRGALKARKVGRRWMLQRADLETYFQAHPVGKH